MDLDNTSLEEFSIAVHALDQEQKYDTVLSAFNAQRIAFHDLYGQYLLNARTDLKPLLELMDRNAKLFNNLNERMVHDPSSLDLGSLPLRDKADSVRYYRDLLIILLEEGHQAFKEVLDKKRRDNKVRKRLQSTSKTI